MKSSEDNLIRFALAVAIGLLTLTLFYDVATSRAPRVADHHAAVRAR